MHFSAKMSYFVGHTKMAAPYMYKDVFIPLALGEMGCRIPFSVVMWRSL
jgi:hypothetical protein